MAHEPAARTNQAWAAFWQIVATEARRLDAMQSSQPENDVGQNA